MNQRFTLGGGGVPKIYIYIFFFSFFFFIVSGFKHFLLVMDRLIYFVNSMYLRILSTFLGGQQIQRIFIFLKKNTGGSLLEKGGGVL